MTIASAAGLSTPQTQVTPLVPAGSSSTNGISFGDLLDAVNPLQHIPVVSGIYRSITGSAISNASKIAGDTLYGFALGGGIVSAIAGAASSAADVAVASVSGSDISSHIVNTVSDKSSADSSFKLIPNAPGTTTESSSEQASAPVFLPLDKKSAITEGQYKQAQIHDAFNKTLLNAL